MTVDGWRKRIDELRKRLDRLKREKSRIEQTSPRKLVFGGGLIGAGLGVAIVSVNIAFPVLSLLGLAIAVAGVPSLIKKGVDWQEGLKELEDLNREVDEVTRELQALEENPPQ